MGFTLSAKNYFQQEVNYQIQVQLNDQSHSLHASERIEYINHSADTLRFIYFHLWPNAYQKNSALDKQLIATGSHKLHEAKEKDKGCIDSLRFTSQGKELSFSYDAAHRDICKVMLAEPLAPGMRVSIETPFRVKLPNAKISRLGHIQQFYAITQWYPKPAVYDAEGWHAMPYLNQGEFYSEYGSFDVSITLPENYVVGATGDLQTESEIEFLNRKAADTSVIKRTEKSINAFPASSEKVKTIRFTQSRVHDFAWFADKRFIVRKSEVRLPHSQASVTTWAMFTPLNQKSWKNATQYINDAVYYYSLWNGDYPYKQCTAIDGTISAGGGMEYPNVTIINSTSDTFLLDVVITHEVGHNWFYGILGSNERDHAWMDEGMNSYNELRYVKTKYPKAIAASAIGASKLTQKIIGQRKLPHRFYYTYSYLLAAMNHVDEPLEQGSEKFSDTNYGLMVYDKSAAAFNLLHEYLGKELFDSCMHRYFEEWKFKHPSPKDVQNSFEEITKLNLSWFFDKVIQTTEKNDYRIAKVKRSKGTNRYTIHLKNRGKLETPIELTAISKTKESQRFMLMPSDSNGVVHLQTNWKVQKFVLDSNLQSLDLNQQNNQYKMACLFHRWRLPQVHFFPHLGSVTHRELYIIPVLAASNLGGFMPGVSVSNGMFPAKKWNWNFLATTGSYTYMINRNWHPNHLFKRITIGVYGRSFQVSVNNYKLNFAEPGPDYYMAMHTSFAEFVYKTKHDSKYEGGIVWKRFSQAYWLYNSFRQVTAYNQFHFRRSEHRLNVKAEQFLNTFIDYNDVNAKNHYEKLNVELKSKFRLPKSRFIQTRLFAGTFFNFPSNQFLAPGIQSYYGYSFWGNNDYSYSDTYVNRSYNTHQTYINDGGVRNRFSSYLNGVRNMLAFNSSFDVLPNGLISVYYDVAYSKTYDALNTTQTNLLSAQAQSLLPSAQQSLTNKQSVYYMAAGLRIALIPDYVEFYVPIFLHETYQGTVPFKNTFKNVGILLNLTKMNPYEASRKAFD